MLVALIEFDVFFYIILLILCSDRYLALNVVHLLFRVYGSSVGQVEVSACSRNPGEWCLPN